MVQFRGAPSDIYNAVTQKKVQPCINQFSHVETNTNPSAYSPSNTIIAPSCLNSFLENGDSLPV